MARGFPVICALLLFPAFVLAAELVDVTGDVQLQAADGSVRNITKTGVHAVPGETLRTLANGRVVLKQDGGRYSVLSANGALKIQQSDSLDQVNGSVFYVFRKLSSLGTDVRYQVKSPIATIGIRGTRFLVKADGTATGEVAVSEGIVSMTAREGNAFSIEKLPENMTFDEFLRSQEKLFRSFQTDEFMAWRKQELESFELFKQQFFVTQNQSVSIANNRVQYRQLGEADAKLIAELDALVRLHEARDEGAANGK